MKKTFKKLGDVLVRTELKNKKLMQIAAGQTGKGWCYWFRCNDGFIGHHFDSTDGVANDCTFRAGEAESCTTAMHDDGCADGWCCLSSGCPK
ncbi:MAG: hypothetical protein QM528_06590 [Phycisphaerales bacterium]|nr:hypothetical protein [Phycisphaerales bacterium]MDI9358596.1 hypothetical protein [Phycisphaerales bacterium]